MIYSGLAGVSVMDVLAGRASLKDRDPAGGKGLALANAQSAAGRELLSSASLQGSPKDIIDREVIPLAAGRGMTTGITPEMVEQANARHGSTITGGTSDHQGPPNIRWAVDMSNGTHPTPQMDLLAKELARKFSMKWDGSGLVTKRVGRYRIQLIYRTMVGGNHFNHVHLGISIA